MSKKIDLRPCPFCGENLAMTRRVLGECWVECHGCGADGPMKESEEEAEAAWNQRIAGEPPAPPGEAGRTATPRQDADETVKRSNGQTVKR